MRNTFGNLFTLTTFGESHGPAVGGVIDGMPAGIDIDTDFIQHELSRRRPGQSRITTSRNEPDQVELLSGVFEGKSTGTPIGFIVRNTNQHSKDYDNMRNLFRPSHADYTYYYKYGIRDHRGGGRSSARITISRCVGGALAKLALKQLGVSIQAYVSQVGDIALDRDYHKYDLTKTEDNIVRCPDAEKAKEMEDLILKVKKDGDTIGGIITCVIKGCPAGLGEPEFGKLHVQLGAAMLSINAVKGFEYGDGFDIVSHRGSEVNDIFAPLNDASLNNKEERIKNIEQDGNHKPQSSTEGHCSNEVRGKVKLNAQSLTEGHCSNEVRGKVKLNAQSNHSGGIQGGISNGQDIFFRVAFKPVATLLKAQPTVDINGNATIIDARGRHDPCVVPRAVPIVEDMAAMVILDNYLINKTCKL